MEWTRQVLVAAAIALTSAACGGGADAVTTTDSRGEGATTSTAGSSAAADAETTTTVAGPSGGGGPASVLATVEGVEYRFSVAEDIAVGTTGAFFPTACEPNLFGAGLFQVVATAVDEAGTRAEPNVNLTLVLPHDGVGTPDMPPEFDLFVGPSADSPLQLDYVLATEDGLAGVGGPAFEGDLGSWTVDGNRITGEVTTFEGDHLREFFTVTFDVTCPAS